MDLFKFYDIDFDKLINNNVKYSALQQFSDQEKNIILSYIKSWYAINDVIVPLPDIQNHLLQKNATINTRDFEALIYTTKKTIICDIDQYFTRKNAIKLDDDTILFRCVLQNIFAIIHIMLHIYM